MAQETKTTKVMKGFLVGIFVIALALGIASAFVGGEEEVQDTYNQAPATTQGW